MRRQFLTALAGSALLIAALLPGAASAASPTVQNGPLKFTKAGLYIVQLRELPTIAYDGKTAGYAATKPAAGKKIDVTSAAVTSYVGYLVSRHDAELAAAGGTKIYDYTMSFNGFAARLTAAQANKLTRDKDVEAVTPNVIRTVNTSSTPTFLGLSDPGGLWSQLGGVGKAGEDIIIGDVDSGIWPESLSFADRVDATGNWSRSPSARKVYQNLPGANVKCQVGEAWTATACNQKLIGARYYNATFGGNAGINASRPWEFNSPRDYNGHGTHTASTAGGNFGVRATGPAASFGSISGMAPRARIAAYKALWSTQDAATASGGNIDLVAAIDQAVADGVDVISYSISGTSTDFLDPVEVSFLFAAQAGVFVSASAGNSGPTVSTVAHPSPWTTTVAAGTHDRAINGSVTLGNGATYFGASIATAVGPAPVILSTAAAATGAVALEARLCFSAGSTGNPTPLDPAKVAGKIVVCDRGTNARTDKSLAVKNAGGIGMILVNTSPNSLNADFHVVPTVHLSDTDGALVKAYVSGTTTPTARINAAAFGTAAAPFTAAFSSRGPLLAGGGDLLKPDVIAPGVDILASVAPPGNGGLNFNLYSGTSMSAPHVSGVAALLKDLHPTWSPMAIKSALMTSAGDVLDGPNTDAVTIFKQGAGHIEPNTAAHPGLVFNSAFDDWRGFLRGQGLCTFCGGTTPAVAIDASNLNGASIAIGDLLVSQTVTRSVTNVESTAATYTPTVTGMSGFTTEVLPASLTINPGQTKTFTVKFTRTSAGLNVFTGGQLTWAGGGHSVRVPLVIRPVALVAPAEVSGTGSPISYDVKFGYTGAFTATARGLVPAQTFAGSVRTDPDQNFTPTVDDFTKKFEITVPAGATFARFALFNNATTATDLDLFVYNSAGTQIAFSAGATSDEAVSILNPAADTYTVWVHGFATANPSPFTLFAWTLGTANAGNMNVSAPASATAGTTGTITLTFTGLTPGTRYLGSVAYGGVAGLPNPTIVRVDTP